MGSPSLDVDNVNLMFIGECNLVGCGMMNLSLTHGVSSQVDTVLVDMILFWRQCQVLYQKVIAYQIKKIETWARECAAIQRVVVVMLVCVLPLVGLVACADDGGDSDGADSKADIDLTDKKQWFKDDGQWSDSKGDRMSLSEGTVAERTARLAEDAGGVVHYVVHAGRGDRTVLVTPQDFIDGETPLIVSLHGFGGNSADHAAYFPLHERVNSHGFALLLPNGSRNADGITFWNPTDECCQGGKSGEDDVGYLTELVAEAQKVRNFGPIIFFGYSNGGFMAYHMACKGLPGLAGVVSLAGTSYVEDASCQGSPPIPVLHIHGTDDSVIMFEGDSTKSQPREEVEPGFYIGAEEIVTRWAHRAGCAWPEDLEPYDTLDLDEWVEGAETQLYRVGSRCGVGIGIELWEGVGSGHSPGYGDEFIDAVGQWFLSHFDSAFDDRCPGYDPRTLKVILHQPHVPVVLRPDLVDQIAEAIRQDLEDPVTIDNLEIEDAGDATLVTVHDSGALGDPSTRPNQRRDGTPFFRIIELYAEAHFEDGMTVFFRVYVNLDDTEQGCVVSGVAIPPLDFVP